MSDAWLKGVLAAAGAESLEQVEKPVPGCDARYPLLGQNGSTQLDEKTRAWKLRLALRTPFPAQELKALVEEVDQLLWLGEGELNTDSADLVRLLKESPEDEAGARLRSVELKGESFDEKVYHPDLQLLKNIACLNLERGSVSMVVAAREPSTDAQTESLIEQTLSFLAGILAGVDVLEVRQGPREGFDSLWPRLNILRLLKWEAGLNELPPICDGAGFFEELQRRTSGR